MEYRASQKARNLLHILRYVRGCTYVFHKKIPGNKLLQPPHLPTENRVTWDQAQFSFCFVNNIPAGKAKRKESLIQTYETSAAHFFDWLTFAESANQNYFRYSFF